MNHKPKNDLLTGESFSPKRINQRFKTAANRIKYHNDKANEQRHSVAHINKPLHQNHRILIELLLNKNEATFHKQFLIGKGYNFDVHTHYEVCNSQREFAIYQYIILSLDKDTIKIIRK